MEEKNMREGCGYKNGPLPPCAPLALAYVPMQEKSQPRYESDKALVRGTLFPGLDLPFMNIVNTGDLSGTAMGELMTLDFVAHEMALYLDTHSEDTEAFTAYQNVLRLAAEAQKRYADLYGPISQADMMAAGSFTWIKNPWPWDFMEKMEG